MNTNHILTRRAWFSGSMLSKKTLLWSFCCSTWGFLAKTFLISATMLCKLRRDEFYHLKISLLAFGNAMKIKSTKIMISTTHINLTNIKVTDSKMGFDSPVSFLTKVSHHIYCELMVRNVHSLTIFTPYHRWWPPTHMLLNNADRQAVNTNWDNYTPSQQKMVKSSAKANGKRHAQKSQATQSRLE